MARKPDVPCALCGVLLWSGSTSLAPGLRMCRGCRGLPGHPGRSKPGVVACAHCSTMFVPRPSHNGRLTVTCSKRCAQLLRVGRVPGDTAQGHNAARYALESSRPGLGRLQRQRILRLWMNQGRSCAYCDAAGTTVDHVVPLFRGGSNFEGNLVPACRPCNISKGRWLLVEWRAHRATKLRCVPEPLRSQAAQLEVLF